MLDQCGRRRTAIVMHGLVISLHMESGGAGSRIIPLVDKETSNDGDNATLAEAVLDDEATQAVSVGSSRDEAHRRICALPNNSKRVSASNGQY